MGVRGKLEAVIYAAEEPVTLEQLVMLFGREALEERAAALSRNREAPDGADASIGFELALNSEVVSSSDVLGNDVPPMLVSPLVSLLEDEAQEGLARTETGEQPQVAAHQTYELHRDSGLIGDPDAAKRAIRLRDREAREELLRILAALMGEYEANDRGMEIREIAGGYHVATKPEYHDAVRAFVKSLKPPMKLTLQALETLAVIAYKQPVTAPEVSEIRGVDSGGVLGSLHSRKLITTSGRKPVVGRPILYKTTKEFLLRFGLKDVAELPSMEEFEKMAGELQSLDEEPSVAPESAPLVPEVSTSDAPELAVEALAPDALQERVGD